jgi:hypothetical protein
MAKSRSGHRPGGGIASKQHVSKPVRTGAQRERIRVAGIAQLGQKQGNKAMGRSERLDYSGVEAFGGTGYRSELGNTIAARTKAGPGGSREVMPTGSQCMSGPVNRGEPLVAKREIFPGFGPRK